MNGRYVYPDTRVTHSVKLTVGKDDDLIAWLENVPSGQRNGLLKTILREYMQRATDTGLTAQIERIERDTVWLRMVLSQLPAQIENVLARVAVSPRTEDIQQEPRGSQLSADSTSRRERRIAKATW
jgi:hypothetical protein